MSESPSFSDWLTQTEPALQAWGDHVVRRICELIKADIGDTRYSTFFKTTPSFRTKEPLSALKKQSKKKYLNPQEQMTDLVGARFVVLLLTDIPIVENAILNHTGWTAHRERHFIHEVDEDPQIFDYQSVHYLVRTCEEISIDGVLVPEQLPCEVQIRTLLQHAYAELVHDRIYKSDNSVPVAAKRLVSRSMALMETTDSMFCEAVRELDQITSDRDRWAQVIEDRHQDITGTRNQFRDDLYLVIDTYRHLLAEASIEAVLEDVGHAVVKAVIRERAEQDAFFANSVCCICYWLIQHHHSEILRNWPLPVYRSGLEQVCADLGFSGH